MLPLYHSLYRFCLARWTVRRALPATRLYRIPTGKGGIGGTPPASIFRRPSAVARLTVPWPWGGGRALPATRLYRIPTGKGGIGGTPPASSFRRPSAVARLTLPWPCGRSGRCFIAVV
ncbi:MAG: hypothetical protein KatS3mg057_0385 [Herpetosiphonaceae bacterium]|nr:MAG: hypothetical protein KatS3mg057_0385 [Herpetosiphonaceae bacterium]